MLYVDDILLTSHSHQLVSNIISTLSSAFVMKDLGPLPYFLGVEVVKSMVLVYSYLSPKMPWIISIQQLRLTTNLLPPPFPLKHHFMRMIHHLRTLNYF